MKLFVDGDLLLFSSCSAVEREAPLGDHRYLLSNVNDAIGVLEEQVADLIESSGIEEIVFALSDKQNWRRNIFPDYKANRKGLRKPLCYLDLIEYVKATYVYDQQAGLEADDLLGIRASEYPIWSLDKDLKQIPGQHLIDDQIVTITADEGDYFHMYQTLVGDPTDGYKGCPGVGAVGAKKLLDATPKENWWEAVVMAYRKAGMEEEDALVQARVARILREGEYDFEKKKVKLWKPNTSS